VAARDRAGLDALDPLPKLPLLHRSLSYGVRL
jgi:hypothetical protein